MEPAIPCACFGLIWKSKRQVPLEPQISATNILIAASIFLIMPTFSFSLQMAVPPCHPNPASTILPFDSPPGVIAPREGLQWKARSPKACRGEDLQRKARPPRPQSRGGHAQTHSRAFCQFPLSNPLPRANFASLCG